jgi:hypothetical protein
LHNDPEYLFLKVDSVRAHKVLTKHASRSC